MPNQKEFPQAAFGKRRRGGTQYAAVLKSAIRRQPCETFIIWLRRPRIQRPASAGRFSSAFGPRAGFSQRHFASMARIVMKFGGTSVADIDRIRNVARHVKREVDAGHEVAVVVSAMAGKTNELVGWIARSLAAARRARI